MSAASGRPTQARTAAHSAELASVSAIVLQSTLTCPYCGHGRRETMPTDACQWLYACTSCQALLRPKAGDCCVFCSYGDVPCPPVQIEGAGRACCG